MSINLREAQLALLNAAAQREDRLLTPPKGLRIAQARRAAGKIVEEGLARVIKAKGGAPVWGQDEEAGWDYTLKLTAAGLRAIATRSEGEGELTGRLTPSNAPASPAPQRETAVASVIHSPAATAPLPAATSAVSATRAGTKIADVIAKLSRSEGTTIDELIAATGWLPHTTRAALTGLRKRGYALISDRSDRTRGSIYRILPLASSQTSHDPAVVEANASRNPEPPLRTPRRAPAPASGHEAP
jgi:hypothetical protein